MEIGDYIKSKWVYLLSLCLTILLITGVLNIIDVDYVAITFIVSILLIASTLPIIIEYMTKRNFYNDLKKRLVALDQKTLIVELIEKPGFLEGDFLYETLEETTKAMNDEIALYKKQVNSYMEYIDLWVHEIKTPITVQKLVAVNNPSEAMTSILEEIGRTEKYVEQVLYYSKSFTAKLDFKVESIDLNSVVSSLLKNEAKTLISKKVRIQKDIGNSQVLTDHKWVKFIMGQMMNNSIQYMDKEEKLLKFYTEESESKVHLYIEDNGMGIQEKDIRKVFNKGYVGENGRLIGKSTGFGLYICKKLCDDLDIGISLESVHHKFTRVQLSFIKAHS